MPIKRLDTFSSSSKYYECRKRIACLKGRISSLSYKMHHHHSSADPSLELRPKVESHDQNSKNDKEFNRRKQKHCGDNQTRHNWLLLIQAIDNISSLYDPIFWVRRFSITICHNDSITEKEHYDYLFNFKIWHETKNQKKKHIIDLNKINYNITNFKKPIKHMSNHEMKPRQPVMHPKFQRIQEEKKQKPNKQNPHYPNSHWRRKINK